ncbi:hypothetical protein C8N47_105132 [Mangrovibacterium marinum]|uniref:Uncharacterized protein n=1 Tax=Mangrovibacterium marinum TaxID=1639118 RepID=A0A2T5C3E4_9BACT|nr:hypothetical protein [Mangrovibacterium marinum]PTN09291.1 hypothetical protein C8N47_105132 [Mangrovibacterium marinum]
MQNKEIQLFQQVGIAKAGNYNYSEIANSFNSTGYTSLAGNTYFNSIWFVEGLAVLADIGIGHTWTFLNGLKIVNIQDKKLVFDSSYHCRYYSKHAVISTVVEKVTSLILESAAKGGLCLNPLHVEQKVRSIIVNGFAKDQRYMLNYNTQKFLKA